tara:strand:- start:1230 stop:1706 length:477 start_codon:yes stop_codon:yes gene_type:complete
MMNRIIILGTILLIICGCNSTKKAQKTLRKIKITNPELFKADTSYSIESDTIMLEVAESRLDTSVVAKDSILVENDRMRISVIKDNLKGLIEIEGICKPDTVFTVNTKTTVEIKEEIKTNTVYKSFIPIWFLVLFGLLVVICISLIIYCVCLVLSSYA